MPARTLAGQLANNFVCALVSLPDCGFQFGNETTSAHVYKVRKWRSTQRTATGSWSNAYIPDLCTLKCVITGYRVLQTYECHYNMVLDVQSFCLASEMRLTAVYNTLTVSVVNTGGELPGVTLSNGRGRSQAKTLSLANPSKEQ